MSYPGPGAIMVDGVAGDESPNSSHSRSLRGAAVLSLQAEEADPHCREAQLLDAEEGRE